MDAQNEAEGDPPSTAAALDASELLDASKPPSPWLYVLASLMLAVLGAAIARGFRQRRGS